MRKVILIDIVHSLKDMGSASKVMEKVGKEKLGEEKWKENQEKIKQFWEKLEEELLSKGLDWEKVRIYQDGLPAGGEEGKNVVKKAMEKGSRNYELIGKLMEKGAQIEKTEDKELLLREIQLLKNLSSSPEEDKDLEKYKETARKLTRERDSFISEQINSTLGEDEIGLLFLGAKHSVEDRLPEDIEVERQVEK